MTSEPFKKGTGVINFLECALHPLHFREGIHSFLPNTLHNRNRLNSYRLEEGQK